MPSRSDTGTATPPLLKHLNERTVLEAIRAAGPISRAEISRRVGISKPTVSLALRSLQDAGLVRQAAAAPRRPGYGAVFFEAVPDAALVLALDVGARYLRGAVCDLRGTVRARHDLELAPGVDDVADAVSGLAQALLDGGGIDPSRLDGAVVGVPGVVERGSGRVELAASLPGLPGRPLATDLGERLRLPVLVENDINLAALGERWQGVAGGIDDFVFLSVGTGLGAGLVLRGELHRGHHGAAGELDFALAGVDEALDPSAAAVSQLAAQAAAARRTTLATPFDTRAIFAAARAGDAVARDVVDEVARRIALHVLPVAAVADVELVVLGGGVGLNADLLLAPIRAHLAEVLRYPPRVEVSSLGEAAVLTGALAVGLRQALDNVFANRAAR